MLARMSEATPLLHALPAAAGSAEALLVPSPRGRMLDAVTALVAEQGYAATSVADVCARAKASRKTFYEQFADKEDCFGAAFRVASEHVAHRVAEAGAAADEAPVARLEAIYGAYLTELAGFPVAARAFLVEIRASGAPSQRHRRIVQDRLAGLLPTGPGDRDDRLRVAVVAASEELIVREIVDHGPEHLPGLAPVLVVLASRVLDPVPTVRRSP